MSTEFIKRVTTNNSIETARKWITSLLTLLIMPVCWLVLDHQRLLIEKFVQENYWSRGAHTEWASVHSQQQDAEIQRVQKQIENASLETRAMSTKLDALIIHVTALQVKMDSMNDSMLKSPASPFKR